MNILSQKCKEMQSHLLSRRANKDALTRMMGTYKTEAESLKADVQALSDSIMLMQTFSGTLRTDVVQKFESLLTKGVRQIFNKDYQISIDFQSSSNSVYADFYVVLPSGRKVSLSNGEGGGLRDFIAVLQRILYIMLEPSMPSKILFLDECLKALDAERSPLAFKFISELCKELGIQVVFITHSQAAKGLVGSSGVSVLEVSNGPCGAYVKPAGV